MSPVDILLVLIVILIIVLVWRGPSMLPQIGQALGKAVKGARDNMDRDAEAGETGETAVARDAVARDDDQTPRGQ